MSSVSLQAFAASTPTGMIYVSGPVEINGKAVAAPTAVFAGDAVQTAASAGATIASKGLRITLASKTGLSFAPDTINLSCGTAAFKSSGSTAVKVGRFTVSPSAQDARFQIMNRNGLVQIAAFEGGIKIFDGEQMLPLAAGKMFTVPSGNACMETTLQDPKQDPNAQQSTGNGNPQGSQGGTQDSKSGTQGGTQSGSAGAGASAGGTGTGAGGAAGAAAGTTSGTVAGGIGAGVVGAIAGGVAIAVGVVSSVVAANGNRKDASPILP